MEIRGRNSRQLRIERFDQLSRLPSLPMADRRLLPDAPGVYYVLAGADRVVYIGVANTSLRDRWRQHSQAKALSALGDIRIAYAICEDGFYRRRAEKFCVATLQPELNSHLRNLDPEFWWPSRPRGSRNRRPADPPATS